MNETEVKFDFVRYMNDKIPVATAALAEEVVASCEKYVPYRTGWLMRNVEIRDSTSFSKNIAYTVPYASECYYATRQFSKKRHPLATARWFEAGKSAHLKDWCNTVAAKMIY